MNKAIIYQVLPRLFSNTSGKNQSHGSLTINGSGKLNYFTPKVLKHFADMGITHMWYTGIIEHATQTDYSQYNIVKDNPQVVKGVAGSPYAVKDYYDVNPDLAEDVPNRINEFEKLVERTHETGMKVIIDFIPNHVARQYISDAKPEHIIDLGENDDHEVSFDINNNFYYLPGTELTSPVKSNTDNNLWKEKPAKATGNDCFVAEPNITDWFETVKLNYGIDYLKDAQKHFSPIPNTWVKMKEILLYWCSKKVDGFRCDMAEMVPVEFWNWCIKEVKKEYPNVVFVAEVYQPHLYKSYIKEGGFDWLYDKVGIYDSLLAVTKGQQNIYSITSAWNQINDIAPHMLFFLENHDEQRLASDFVFSNPKKALAAFILTATFNNNPLMIYNGQEIGEKGMDEEGFSGKNGRTTIFDYWSVESLSRYYKEISNGHLYLTEEERALKDQYTKIIQLTHRHNGLSKGERYDLVWSNKDNSNFKDKNIYSWLRYDQNELFLIAVNFTDTDQDCRVMIPEHAFETSQFNQIKYFKGIDLLEQGRKIQFPKEIATHTGVGLTIPKYNGVIYKIV